MTWLFSLRAAHINESPGDLLSQPSLLKKIAKKKKKPQKQLKINSSAVSLCFLHT